MRACLWLRHGSFKFACRDDATHDPARMTDLGLLDARLLSVLACPRDRLALQVADGALHCAHGHRYPVVNGIPVFLLPEAEQTIGVAAASLRAAQDGHGAPLYLDTIGVSAEERRGIARDWRPDATIDAAISYLIGATAGHGYSGQIGHLGHYPIPDIPIGRGHGGFLLDVGSNWGRWSVAAARKGWVPVGIDPSLGALLASRRAFGRSEPPIHLVCGDARYLPFTANAFDAVFSYSVLQHFSETDADIALGEIGRVLVSGGFAKIQMAHTGGLRSRQITRRKTYASSGAFRVRYWPLDALREVFMRRIGPTRLAAEAFGGLGLLAGDWSVVSAKAKLLIDASGTLKSLARAVPALIRIADSVYVEAVKR